MKSTRYYSLWLCLIIIIIFILQIIIPNLTENFVLNSKLYEGQVYRALTPIFLHGSIPHLLYNLFALALFGFILENIIGSKKFLLVFFITGIAANLISVNFYNSSLGASGAIMGIIGALVILRPTLTVWAFGIPMPMFVASVLWIIGDIIGIFMPSSTANIAHLGGIAIGFVFGIFYKSNFTEKKTLQKIHIPDREIEDWEMTYLVKR